MRAARMQDQDIILGEIIIAAVRGSIDKSVIYAIEEVLKKHLGSKGYELLEQKLLTI